ncbi:PQ loop repeat-domain-containing protein [Auriculariales sp. MPI-PUGE-AT-0066]|nr:PQ loop repeat-domain-containing protein [Auriculariales sp. MPI-PUGE-AT-0066]
MARVNQRAADALGTLGVIFWSVQVIPQIWKSYRSKSTDGLSAWLMLIWAAASIPLGTYNIVSVGNIPLIVQPQAFAALCSCSWAQVLHYSHKLSPLQAFGAWLALQVTTASLEVAFVIACRAGERHGTSAPTKFFGVLSAVMILGGIIPQYYEIWKYKVVGLSLIFIFIDLLGALVSCLSLVFQPEFDWLASVTYGGLVVLEVGIFIAAAILNPRAKRRRQEETELEVDAQHLAPGGDEKSRTCVSPATAPSSEESAGSGARDSPV